MDDAQSIDALETATVRISALAASLAAMDTSGTIRAAIDEELTQLSIEAQAGVLAKVPAATGALRASVRVVPAPGRRPGFTVTAGAFTPRGENYGWFTELGTEDHAVDRIGYQHRTTNRKPRPGIPAQHWLSGPTDEVLRDAPRRIRAAIYGALRTLLTT